MRRAPYPNPATRRSRRSRRLGKLLFAGGRNQRTVAVVKIGLASRTDSEGLHLPCGRVRTGRANAQCPQSNSGVLPRPHQPSERTTKDWVQTLMVPPTGVVESVLRSAGVPLAPAWDMHLVRPFVADQVFGRVLFLGERLLAVAHHFVREFVLVVFARWKRRSQLQPNVADCGL